MKTDKMIESRQDDSAKKTKMATEQIKSMLESKEPVTVKELVKRTGLSRAFFYANEVVHEALQEAQEQQKQKRIEALQKENLDKPKAKRRPQKEVPRQVKKQPLPQKEVSSQRKKQPSPQKNAAEQMKERQLIFLEQQNEKLRMEAALLRRENQELKELLKEQEEQLCQYL